MTSYDRKNAQCTIFTFREGLLAKAAHDLKIHIERFEIELAPDLDSVTALFHTDSLRVICARKDGRDAPSLLSRSDIATIEGAIRSDVLHSVRFPAARFHSTRVIALDATRREIEGELELHGRRKTLRFEARLDDDRWVASLSLHQPDFGIAPYRAMLGALKIRPDVQLVISLGR